MRNIYFAAKSFLGIGIATGYVKGALHKIIFLVGVFLLFTYSYFLVLTLILDFLEP